MVSFPWDPPLQAGSIPHFPDGKELKLTDRHWSQEPRVASRELRPF